MSSKSEPEDWAAAMERKGISSERHLAREVGVHQTTIGSMLRGTRATKPVTLRKVADVLGVDIETVSRWAQQALTSHGPYEPPARTELLSPTQRQALNAVITAMLEGHEDGESRGDTTPKKPAPVAQLSDRRRTPAVEKKTAARRARITQPDQPGADDPS